MTDESSSKKRGMSRGSFLKSIAGIGGAGVGVLFGASKADAASPAINGKTTCCHTTAAPCPGCAGAKLNYKCTSDCYSGYVCACYTNMGNCFTVLCSTS